MTQGKAKEESKKSSPGCLTHVVVYIAVVTAMYFARTPEVTGGFTEAQKRSFHIAGVSKTSSSADASPIALSLAQFKDGKLNLASVTFLLPEGDIRISAPGADLHKVTVLERHPDWQLVEYHYGNSHNSVSRYRAFKDRIEPVSYRMTMDAGMAFSAMVLLVPALMLSALINAIWARVSRTRNGSDVA